MTLIFMTYMWDIDNNWYIWLIYDRKSPNVSVRYDLATVFARVRWGAMILKLSATQIFPNVDLRGGHQISAFSQTKKCPHYPRKRWVKKIMAFSTFGTCLECFPNRQQQIFGQFHDQSFFSSNLFHYRPKSI